MNPFRILLYGSDARTDAIAAACQLSTTSIELYTYAACRTPGLHAKSGGGVWYCDLMYLPAMVDYATACQPDLVIIGPEAPLVAGLVDELLEFGIPCFGPTKTLALIESSKSWARQLMDDYDIPVNPEYTIFTSPAGLAHHLGATPEFVIKPDGLTGGKGVKVFPEHFTSRAEAIVYAGRLAAEGPVLIEERLEGEEFSLMSITDGETVIHCPAVQDHKRAYEGDTGPNTGGMGSYSDADHSLPFLDDQDIETAQRTNEAVVRALYDRTGQPYRGVLYGGFIATSEGTKLIEYNARFGDPEAMNVLPLLQGDFVQVALDAANGSLSSASVAFAPTATVCKYLVPHKYPESGGRGEVVVPETIDNDHVRLYWAATNMDGGRYQMTGSRALAVVGLAPTIAQAEAHAERAATAIEQASAGTVRHRRDIGTQARLDRRIEHMRSLRERP